MKLYIITISDCYGSRRNTAAKARSRQEAISAVYTDDNEFISVCRELD